MSQLHYIINRQMSRKISKEMIEKFLHFSPHRILNRYKQIMPIEVRKPEREITDEVYIEMFMKTINCDYLHTNEFYHHQNKTSKFIKQATMKQYSCNLPNTLNKRPQKSEKQKGLLAVVRNLNEKVQSFTILQQNLEMITSLSPEEALTHKKYLIYIYKIILNRNHQLESPQDIFWADLKATIIQKIYDAHADQLERQQVQEQLMRIQMLINARASKAVGDINKAKQNYQLLFEDGKSDENIRMEALEYLCKKSEEKGDQGYLLGMISKIKEKGEQKHKKFVENVLNKLHRNRTSDEKMASDPSKE